MSQHAFSFLLTLPPNQTCLQGGNGSTSHYSCVLIKKGKKNLGFFIVKLGKQSDLAIWLVLCSPLCLTLFPSLG